MVRRKQYPQLLQCGLPRMMVQRRDELETTYQQVQVDFTFGSTIAPTTLVKAKARTHIFREGQSPL
jgi:hypothetical protein